MCLRLLFRRRFRCTAGTAQGGATTSQTSDAAWAHPPGAVKSGYTFPSGSRAACFHRRRHGPPSTRPLYLWYSASRRSDNFTTSDPRWAGTPGAVQSGYTFVSVQGYVHSSGLAGTIPLRSSYKGSVKEDNRATSNPIAAPAGYSFYRTEGYLTPPADSAAADSRHLRLREGQVRR